MPTAKVAITLDRETLGRVDRLVKAHTFPNRSRAIQAAVEEKLERLERSRLARESAKLNRAQEQAMAEEGFETEGDAWPAY